MTIRNATVKNSSQFQASLFARMISAAMLSGAIVYGFAAPGAAWSDIIAADFNVTGAAIPTGNEPGGFALPVGAFWNALDIGASVGGVRNSDSISSLKLIDGTTTTGVGFSMTAANGYSAFLSTATNAVRNDVVFLQGGFGVGPISWEITNLTPGNSYDLRLFGQYDTDGVPINDATFTVSNTGGGTITTADVASFNSVIADGGGKILGTLVDNGAPSSWSGFEIQGELVNVIPEPSTLALAALGLLSLGLIRWRRRRRA
ncbi:MAG: PEP-CTERM sorting domain-containing protein [Chloroflexi bacterium]|nr:PEP-CTERM sorting domain-containing protein [Chloroflexota bacterium]